MAKGFKHGTSGSKSPLNFQVKTYPSETELKADTPSENTVGVCTTTTVSSWIFSTTEPKTPEVGMVWICVDKSSPAEFNALKENALQVYPINAKQYVSGAWQKITAMSYQSGKWVTWLNYTYLYETGDECTSLTGGWLVAGKRSDADTNTSSATPTVTRAEKHLLATISSDEKSGILHTKSAIDLTNYKKLVAEGEFLLANADASSNNISLCIWTSIGTYYRTNLVSRVGVNAKGTIVKRLEMDLSTTNGNHIVGFIINTTDNAGGSYVKLEKCWLES